MSGLSRRSPTPRRYVCSQPLTSTPPPAFPFDRSSASTTSRMESPYFTSRSGWTSTWYCFTAPPKLFTSFTPATGLSSGATTQFCSVRSSIGEWRSLSSVYWKISPSPVLMGPSSGATPGGNASRAAPSRSNTTCRVHQVSAPSSNTTTTWESPALESERTWRTRGRPRIACSMGKLTRSSTSTAARPGALASTITWVLVTSGKASMGRLRQAATPPAVRSTVARRTRSRLSSSQEMAFMARSLVRASRAHLRAQDVGLEEEATLGGHGLAPGEPLHDLHLVPGCPPRLDRPAHPVVAVVADEDEGASLVGEERRTGHDQRIGAGRQEELHVHEHAGPEPPLRVGHADPDLERAGLLVHRGRHEVHGGGEHLPRERLRRDGGPHVTVVLVGEHLPHLPLVDVGHHPHLRQVADGEYVLVGTGRLAGNRVHVQDGPRGRGTQDETTLGGGGSGLPETVDVRLGKPEPAQLVPRRPGPDPRRLRLLAGREELLLGGDALLAERGLPVERLASQAERRLRFQVAALRLAEPSALHLEQGLPDGHLLAQGHEHLADDTLGAGGEVGDLAFREADLAREGHGRLQGS